MFFKYIFRYTCNNIYNNHAGTPFRGTQSRASVFNLFPDADGERREIDDDHYPAADSPAFFTIHNPLGALELEYNQSPNSASPSLSIDTELARGGSPLESPEKKDWGGRTPNYPGIGREGSNSQRTWEGADSKEMLARELGFILQANPSILRTLSEVSGGAGGSNKSSLSNSGGSNPTTVSTQHVSLEDLMNSLTAGIDGTELVRPLSGHFSRVAHLEDQVKDMQNALDAERAARCATEDALDVERIAHARTNTLVTQMEEMHARVATQVTQAQDEGRRLEAYASVHQDQELVDMARSLVNYMDTIIVNINKGINKPPPPVRANSTDWATMKDTIEGLKEENATLDKLYRQTKAELELLQVQHEGGGQDSLRKKNKQLAKELEMLHKDYDTLLHSKGGDDATTDESDDFFEDKRGRRKNKSGFLKRIMG